MLYFRVVRVLRKISRKWCWRRKTADLNLSVFKNPNEAMNISCIVNGAIRKTQHLQKVSSFFLKAGIPVGMWELLVQMATLCREPVHCAGIALSQFRKPLLLLSLCSPQCRFVTSAALPWASQAVAQAGSVYERTGGHGQGS